MDLSIKTRLSRRSALTGAASAAVIRDANAADAAIVRRGYSDARTGQIHYRSAGKKGSGKRPMICSHPTKMSSLYFEAWLREIGRDRFAVALDTPGAGMSDIPSMPLTISEYARAIGDVIDHLGLSEYDFFGAATGAAIGVELARQRPNQIEHLVLVTAPIFTQEEIKALSDRNVVFPLDEDGAFMANEWKRIAERRDPRMSLEELLPFFRDLLAGGRKRMWAADAAFAYLQGDYLAKVKAPVLVINPSGVLYESTLRVDKLIKKGKLINRPDWPTTEFMTYDTVAVVELVKPFLDEGK